MPFRSDMDVLPHIAQTAQGLARCTMSFRSSLHFSLSSAPEEPPPALVLPAPKPLTSDLVAIGLDFASAEKFSDAYLKSAMQLKTECEIQFRRANDACCQINRRFHQNLDNPKSQSLLQAAFLSRCTRAWKSWAHQVINVFGVQLVEGRRRRKYDTESMLLKGSSPRRKFKQNAVPILQGFFDHNAFPSRSDKEDLAARTDMEYRQINVWFQNRRNRYKKDGKELKRAGAFRDLPPELGNSLAEILSDDDLASDADLHSFVAGEPSIVRHGNNQGFQLDAAPHAFPAPYPPPCAYDPFPIQKDSRHFATPWPRMAAESHSQRSPCVDMTQLSGLFEKLRVTDAVRKGDRRPSAVPRTSVQSRTRWSDKSAAAIGFTTAVPLAPLPSFLPATTVAVASKRPIPAIHASSNVSFSPLESTQVTSSLTTSTKKTGLRKAVRLPRRMPTSASISHHQISSNMSSPSQSSCDTRWSSSDNASPMTPPLASSSKADLHVRMQPYRQPSLSVHPRPPALGSVAPANEGRLYIPIQFSNTNTIAPDPSVSSLPDIVPFSGKQVHSHNQVSSKIPSSTPLSRRKVAALPNRTPRVPHHLPRGANLQVSSSSHSPSTLTRMSSVSSISSASSSGEDDSPVHTPPLLPTHLSSPKLSLGPDPDYLLGQSYMDGLSPIENLQLDFLSDRTASDITKSMERALALSGSPGPLRFRYGIPFMS
ncbi:hypothetical protein B0H21DRAFT_728964 [Amylocystis lapponica]|nr:hypothetical protein B0H21DRAFT_728964 [Amylocystis lapponica]